MAVDARSISAAAVKLHIVQSAVSHQIAQLEQGLGAKLLLRTKAGVTPTEAGTILYQHARALMKGVDVAREAVCAADKKISGRVSIGIPSGTAIVLSLPLLEAVRRRFPHVTLSIIEGLSAALGEQLGIGRLNLAVLYGPRQVGGLESTPLLEGSLHLISQERNERTSGAGETIPLAEAVSRPLVLPPDPSIIRTSLEAECTKLGFQLDIVADLSSVSTILGAVRMGIGDTIAMVAGLRLSSAYEGLTARCITQPTIQRSIELCHLRNATLTKAEESVKALTIEVARNLVASGSWHGATLRFEPTN